MADSDKKRYYWLKLQKDFFKRHDIRIIESMPNGKDYILFYLKLLCESTSHEGNLRFSDTIPYSEEMLATITNTNVDIVRTAIKIFSELHMIEVMDDGTYFMREVQKMIGSETGKAARAREYRQKKLLERHNSATLPPQCGLEIELELDKDKELEIDKDKEIVKEKKTKRFTKPTLEEIKSYCSERNNNVNPERFLDYYESNGWRVGKNPMKDWKAAIRTWERNEGSSQKKESSISITKFDV